MPRIDEPDRLGEEDLVAVRQAARVVEETEAEGEVEGERDQHPVSGELEEAVAVDGVVQAPHYGKYLSRFADSILVATRLPAYNPRLPACSPFASFSDFFLDPIVNAGTDFIGSTGLPAVFLLMTLESRLHADPERGDHAVRRLQRRRTAN